MSLREAFKEVRRKNREAGIKKGAESELKVHSALELLTDLNKILTWWPANWYEDVVEKTDVIIMTTEGDQLEMQIKSTKKTG